MLNVLLGSVEVTKKLFSMVLSVPMIAYLPHLGYVYGESTASIL